MSEDELIEKFSEFYRGYYQSQIRRIADQNAESQEPFYIDWIDLKKFNSNLAEDFQNHPIQIREYAEEALPLNVDVCVRGFPQQTKIQDITADHRGTLIATRGIVVKTGEIQPELATGAFECQHCGTLTRISQVVAMGPQEPRECQGCERRGPFQINQSQSEFVEAQTVTLYDSLALQNAAKPKAIEGYVKGDLAGTLQPGTENVITVMVRSEATENGSLEFFFEVVGVERVRSGSLLPLNNADEQAQSGIDSSPDAPTLGAPTDQLTLESYIQKHKIAFSAAASAVLATHPDTIREEETKAKLIAPFIASLGWIRYNYREWKMEYSDEKTSHRVDFALFGPESESPDIVVEAKQLRAKLATHEEQVCDYIRIFDAEWGVLTDGCKYRLYYNGAELDAEKGPAHLTTITLSDIHDGIPPILNALTRAYYFESRSHEQLVAHIKKLAEEQATTWDDDNLSQNILDLIKDLEEEYKYGVPVETVVNHAEQKGASTDRVREKLSDLKYNGQIHEPFAHRFAMVRDMTK